jgi:diguanylate cyclase (GGDEF)-like protein/PAS domain S-box-containing protein
MPSPRHYNLAIGDLLDILPDAVIMVDASGRITFVNPAVRSLFGYEPQELLEQPLSLLMPHESRERHAKLVARFHHEGTPTMMGSRPVLHAVHRAGHLMPVSISLCNLTLEHGERVSVAVVHDVSTLHTHLDRATAKAETDVLTGLGNRLRLSRRMQALLSAARPFALLLLDLAHFKRFKVEHGHEAGDQLLRAVGRRLHAQMREGDLVARLGGGEFMLLFDSLDDVVPLRDRALEIARSVTRPLRLAAPGSAPGVHIAGVLSPRHGTSAPALLDAAGGALHGARQANEVYRLAGEG